MTPPRPSMSKPAASALPTAASARRRRAHRLQPAFHRHDGSLGPSRDRRACRTREVILFNNAGVSSSSGETPDNFQDMGANAIAFIRALGLKQVDVLGISIGGFVAQEIALQGGDLVRKIILVGTGHRGQDMTASRSAEFFAASYDPPEHLWLAVHFKPTETSRKAGLAFLDRKLRRQDRDPGRHTANHGSAGCRGRQVDRAAKGWSRLSAFDQAAHARRAGQRRRDYPDHPLADAPARTTGCATHHLPGLGSWIDLPIS